MPSDVSLPSSAFCTEVLPVFEVTQAHWAILQAVQCLARLVYAFVLVPVHVQVLSFWSDC